MTATSGRRSRAGAALLLAAGATALFVSLGSRPAEAFPVPSPVYSIIATSGTHTASVLNLPLGQPGLPHVPMPVDVDGDLLPDVLVSVNVIEIGGAINNPPNPASILQPNLQIDRLLTTPLLGQSNPPLRIEAKLRLIDVGGPGPDTYIRFGYETGPGGSIPPTWKATLGGLPQLFNPLSATVDTGPSAGRPVSYDGPLRLVGNITTGPTSVELGFGFSPFPQRLALTYLDDAAGQHLTYAHTSPREVDLRADLDMVDADGEVHLDARVERLPGEIAVDIAPGGSDSGAITWASDSDGRRPDVDVHLETSGNGADDEPLVADIDLDSLPQDITAAWSLPKGGPTDVVFDAGGQGIGGVDIDIRNHLPQRAGRTPALRSDRAAVPVDPAGAWAGQRRPVPHLWTRRAGPPRRVQRHRSRRRRRARGRRLDGRRRAAAAGVVRLSHRVQRGRHPPPRGRRCHRRSPAGRLLGVHHRRGHRSPR